MITISDRAAERFNAKWEIGPVPEEHPELGPCHLWTASTNAKGYGTFRLDPPPASPKLAYHVSWMMDGRTVPEGLQLDHRCHRRACIRREHLRLVKPKTNSENRKGANSNSTSGHRGVHWSTRSHRWIVTVSDRGRKHHGGTFLPDQTVEAAEAAERLIAEVFG